MELVVYEMDAIGFPREVARGGVRACVLALLARLDDAELTRLKTDLIGRLLREPRPQEPYVTPPEAGDLLAIVPDGRTPDAVGESGDDWDMDTRFDLVEPGAGEPDIVLDGQLVTEGPDAAPA